MPKLSLRPGPTSSSVVIALALVASVAAPAAAYVDPGIVATLYQLGYLFAFGLLTALVLKPFRFIKASYERLRGRLTRSKQP